MRVWHSVVCRGVGYWVEVRCGVAYDGMTWCDVQLVCEGVAWCDVVKRCVV